MNVSSYLEAFLMVYGWETYFIIYLALAASGLFIYPLVRMLIDQYIEFQSSSEYAGQNYIRSAIASIVIMILVFIFALTPMVPVSFEKTVVKTVCDKADVSVNEFNSKSSRIYFKQSSTKAPILPYMAMVIGQGLNAVIYRNAPCALDITDLQNNALNVSLDNAGPDAPGLMKETDRYMNECQTKIRKIIDDLEGNKAYSQPTNQWYREKVREVSEKNRGFWYDTFHTDKLSQEEELEILKSPDSELVANYFFTGNVPAELKPAIDGLNADGPVVGFNGADNGSAMQGKDTPPSCADWWRGGSGGQGLRTRVAKGLSDDLVKRTIKANGLTGIAECREIPRPGPGGVGYNIPPNIQRCRQAVIQAIANGDGDLYIRQLLVAQQGMHASDRPISSGEEDTLTAMVASAVGASILSKWLGVDLSGGIAGTLVAFYSMLWLLKLLLRYLVPFAEMSVYMFWGIFMVVGGFSGRTIIKGMILIISLIILPSLWALMAHLDDKLYAAMYANGGGGVFNRIILDVASAIFQIGIVYVLFHVVSLAGGGDASGAIGGNKDAGQLSNKLGANVSGVAIRGARQTGNYIKGKVGNWIKPGK